MKDIAPHPTPILTLSRSIEELIPSDMDESYEEFDDSGAGEDEEPTVILREETQEEDIIEELEEFDEFDEFDEDESSKGSQKQTMSKLEEKAKEREPVNTKKVVEKKVDKSEKEEIPSQESQEEPVKRVCFCFVLFFVFCFLVLFLFFVFCFLFFVFVFVFFFCFFV